jgi:hypothetical protein
MLKLFGAEQLALQRSHRFPARYIDDTALAAFDIVVGGLQQLEDDVFDVLVRIAGFGERASSARRTTPR